MSHKADIPRRPLLVRFREQQTILESKPERAPGGAPLQPMPRVRSAAPGVALSGQHARGVVSFRLRTSHGRGV